jgi:LPXTG-motif cell wall-anchored protein
LSRKWVEKEGPRWVERGIVSTEQYRQILSLYDEKKHAIGVLPLLGSMLVGLGILSFVAANWQDIPQLARLAMIAVVMVLFYAGGESLLKKGYDRLGISLVAVGLVTFGAGIVLVGQMFHLMAYDIASFIVWAVAGTLLTYLYRSRFLYLISLLIFTGAQWYSAMVMHHFSFVAFGLMIAGLGYYMWERQNALLTWGFSLSFVIQAIMLADVMHWKFAWVFVPVMALYTLGDWLKDRSDGYALQTVPLITAFTFCVSMVLFYDEYRVERMKELLPYSLLFAVCMLLLLTVSIAGKIKFKREVTAFDWILVVPFAYLPAGAAVMYLLALFFFSFYVLWRGYIEEWRFKINFGTVLFIITTMVAYGKLAFRFMDKSLFFILGGLILLGLSWFLTRRKKQFFDDVEGGDRP